MFRFAAFAALLPVAWACNSGSGGSGDGGSGSGGDGGGAGGGTVTFSCNGGGMCTGIDGVPSDTAGEKAACAKQIAMTFAVAPCPSANLIACCTHPLLVAGQNEEECYYAPDYSNPNSLSFVQDLCGKLKYAWIMDGGAGPTEGGTATDGGDASVGPSSFVGTWARSGTQIDDLPDGIAHDDDGRRQTWSSRSAPRATRSSGTQPDGCAVTYMVSGDTATAAAGQAPHGDARRRRPGDHHDHVAHADPEHRRRHLFLKKKQKKKIILPLFFSSSTASASIDKLATGTTCTSTSSGTYTKK